MKLLKLALCTFSTCFILIFVIKHVASQHAKPEKMVGEEEKVAYMGVFFDAKKYAHCPEENLDIEFGEPTSVITRTDGIEVRTYCCDKKFFGDFYIYHGLCVRVDLLPEELIAASGTLLELLGIEDTDSKLVASSTLTQQYEVSNEKIKHVDIYRDSIDTSALWYADIFYEKDIFKEKKWQVR